MLRSRFFNQTPLLLLATLALACSPSGDPPAGSDDGTNDSSDDTFADDKRPSGDDRADRDSESEGSEEGKPKPSTEDRDNDGLPEDRDLCPSTPEGEEVDANGCARTQTESPVSRLDTTAGLSEEERSELAKKMAAEIKDGEIADNGFVSFVLDPAGRFPVVLRTLAKHVKEIETGYELDRTVLIQVPGGQHITLLEAKIKLERDPASGPGLQSFEGTAKVPFPAFGVLKGVEWGDPAGATVGYERGAEIEGVEGPIDAARKYFYFNFSAGLSAELGDASLSAGDGQAATLTLDPSDPAIFLRAALSGLLGPIEEAAVGFSLGGHLPFAPKRTWGIDENAIAFRGHLFTAGKVSLSALKLPLVIGGNTLYDLDPDDDGKTVFQDPLQGYQFGTNSRLDLSLSAGSLGFEVPIAEGTAVGRVGRDGVESYFSGLIRSGNDWLHGVVPIETTTDLKSAGHLSTDIRASYLQAEGDFALDGGTLGEWTGLSLDDLAVVKAKMRIDQAGVTLTGTSTQSFGPLLGLASGTRVVAFFNGSPKEWYVSLDGDLDIAGVHLSSGAGGRLDKDGLEVRGDFKTPISSIEMEGSITKNGVDVRGRKALDIPIVGGKETLQIVTDAAVCGTEAVADAALCGTELVRDGARCGYGVVRSAAECGYSTVTSAAECGVQIVEDGARCGYQTITSAARCGTETVWSCIASCLSGNCNCEKAKSCSVPKSCEVARTCQIEATCNIPNTCEVPRTCEKVKTCEHRVIVPDFDYGKARVVADLRIGDSGLHGSVSGEFCATDGSCAKVSRGRVDLTSGTPRVCIDVPVAGGEFCAPL